MTQKTLNYFQICCMKIIMFKISVIYNDTFIFGSVTIDINFYLSLVSSFLLSLASCASGVVGSCSMSEWGTEE